LKTSLKEEKSDFSTPGSGRIGIDGRVLKLFLEELLDKAELEKIEDFIKGNPSDPVRDSSGGMFGGNMGAAALAALLGKVTYDAAKERSGGLADTPAVSMDQLGRYQLSRELGTGGTRGEFGLPAAQKALEFNMGVLYTAITTAAL
jgi:hypothetical protein